MPDCQISNISGTVPVFTDVTRLIAYSLIDTVNSGKLALITCWIHQTSYCLDWQAKEHTSSPSLSVLYKAKSFACSSLPSLSCAVYSTWKLASYFYTFFTLYSLHSDCLLACSNLASFSAPLLHSFFFLLHFFCTMPQGPPGPQGSPHPQPPPPNSMMGPHAQVTLHLSLSFLLVLFFYLCGHVGMLVLGADAFCFGIHCSSVLCLVFSIRKNLPLICWYSLIKILWNHDVFVTVLHVTSFCWRPKRPPHKDGQSGRSCIRVHILNTSHVNIEVHF